MSATRDPSQKHTFVYSNLYHLYQKGKVAAKAADLPNETTKQTAVAKAPVSLESDARSTAGIVTGRIIKAEEMSPGVVGLRVARHEPPALLGKRLGLNSAARANRPVKVDATRRAAIDGLRDNLRSLQTLHERLRFMLKEIEDLTKSD